MSLVPSKDKVDKICAEVLDSAFRQEEIKKIAKRITMLMRDLEAHSLDMVLYSKSIAAGKFPVSHLVQVENSLTTASTELLRIQKAWHDLFKGEIENVVKNK